MHVMSIPKFERFFRLAAGLDVDKTDLKRYSDFVNCKIYDLLLRGQAAAKANGRNIIEPFDLPITKGLQESIHEFRSLDAEIELQPILDDLLARPPLDLASSDETEARFPEIAGGLSVALPQLQDHRPQCEEPAERAVGTLLPDLRSPAVDAFSATS